METPWYPISRSIAIWRAKDRGDTTKPRMGVPEGGGVSTWWYIRMGMVRFIGEGAGLEAGHGPACQKF